MRIATFVSNGKVIEYANGVFLVDGEGADAQRVAEYDRLGLLKWESEDSRAWARQLASGDPPSGAPEVGSTRQLGRSRPGWRPTLAMLVVTVAWAAVIRLLPNSLGAQSDLIDLITQLLVGGLVAFAVPATIGQFHQAASAQGRRVTVWILYALIGVPVAVSLVSTARDVVNPVTRRPDGQAPSLAALVGRSERDAERILNHFEIGDIDTGEAPGYLKMVHYTLPDIQVAPPGASINSVFGLTLNYRKGLGVAGVNLMIRADSPLVGYPSADFPLQTLRSLGIEPDSISGPFPVGDTELVGWAGTAGANEWAIMLQEFPPPGLSLVQLSFGPGVIADDMRPYLSNAVAPADSQPTSPAQDGIPQGSPEAAVSTDTDELSEAALDYARGLGGKSHKGETLYLIVGASASPESFAQKKLDDAIPYFGDMQSYFIVQKSDNFDGLKPGWWVVIEAYRSESEARENLDFARRGFEDGKNSPYIKRATVKTDDPIPVNFVDVNPAGD